MRLLFLLTPLFLVASMATAADGGGMTLKAIVDRAIQRNPDLKALELDAAAQNAKVDQAGRWEDPSLELGVSRKDEPVGRTNFGSVGVSQAISRPGRLKAKSDAARSQFKLSQIDRTNSEIEIRGRVLELAYLFRVASEKSAHAKERFERFKNVEAYLHSRPFAAPQKRAEAAIVRSKIMVLQKQVRELQSAERVAWNQLNLYLGFDKEIAVAAPWYQSAPEYSESDLMSRAEQANPDLKRQIIKVEAQDAELRAARADSWPGLTLSATYSNGSGVTPEKDYGLGVSFPIPLLNGNRGSISAAESMKNAEESRLSWAKQKMSSEVNSALEHYKATSKSIVELSTSKMERLERDMKDIDAGFKRSQVDLITYIEADNEHIETLDAILDTQADFISSLRELLHLVGEAPHPLEK